MIFWRRFYIWPLGSRSKVMGEISWYPWAPGRGEKKFKLYWFSWSPGVSFDFGAVFHMTFGVKVKGHGSNKLVSTGARQGWEKIQTLYIFLVSRCKFRFWRRFYIWPLGSRSKVMGQISWYPWAPGRGEKKFELYWFFYFFIFGRRFYIWPLGSRSKVMGEISWYSRAPGRGEKKFKLYWFSWSPGVSFDFGAVFTYDLWGQGQRSWVK